MTAERRLGLHKGTAAAALALVGAGLAACHDGDGAGRGGARTSIPACRPDDLAFREIGQSSDGRGATYRFENRSHAVCVLKGRPDIVLQGADGKPLTATIDTDDPMARLAEQGLKVRPSKVVLRPGRRAVFTVVLPKPDPAVACRPFVRVTATPPGGDWGLDVAHDGRLCGDRFRVSTFTYDGSDE